jgi:F-box/WD-40 domain protein 7
VICLTLCGNKLFSGSSDSTIRVWDADTHKCLATLEGHTVGSVLCLTLYGNKLFSGSYDRTIRVWDADTHKHLATLEGHTSAMNCLTPYGNKLFSADDGYDGGTIRVWNVKEY